MVAARVRRRPRPRLPTPRRPRLRPPSHRQHQVQRLPRKPASPLPLRRHPGRSRRRRLLPLRFRSRTRCGFPQPRLLPARPFLARPARHPPSRRLRRARCRRRTPSPLRLCRHQPPRRRRQLLPHRRRPQPRRALQRPLPSRSRASRPPLRHRNPANQPFRTSWMPHRRSSVEHAPAPHLHPCGVARPVLQQQPDCHVPCADGTLELPAFEALLGWMSSRAGGRHRPGACLLWLCLVPAVQMRGRPAQRFAFRAA